MTKTHILLKHLDDFKRRGYASTDFQLNAVFHVHTKTLTFDPQNIFVVSNYLKIVLMSISMHAAAHSQHLLRVLTVWFIPKIHILREVKMCYLRSLKIY